MHADKERRAMSEAAPALTRPAPGVYPEVAEAVYRAWPAANYSSLKLFAQSPAHVRWVLDHPAEPTPAMLLGSAVDCLVFEPGSFRKRFALAPNRRTNTGKDEAAELEAHGICLLTIDEMQRAREMACAVDEHPAARRR